MSGLLNATHERFDEALHGRFEAEAYAEAGAQRVELQLIEVRAQPEFRPRLWNGDVDAHARIPFSLLFRADPQVRLLQDTYPMRHAVLGEFTMFLVPVGRDRRGRYYEAVFN
jgi:hypothetical protein